MAMRRLNWYIHRLAAMSGAEIAHRICEQFKKTFSSYRSFDFSKSVDEIASLPVLPGIKDNLRLFESESRLLGEWGKLAQDVKSGHFHLLGVEWPDKGRESKWFLDPHTGNHWSQSEYCFRIPYRHTSELGDVKYVWELNRLQYLQPMAALAAIGSDQEMAAFCAKSIESWIDNNPPYKGINWASGIELSCRLVSVIVVISLIGADYFTGIQRRKIWSTLEAHGYWLYRFPSKYSSANNHLVAEASGLFLLGMLAPSLRDSERWLKYGKETLIRETGKQIYVDGVGAEQSPTYLAFTLEWLLLCAHVSRKNGEEFPDVFWKRIESAGDYLRWITDTSGNQPKIGDDDEGRVFYQEGEPDTYVCSVMSSISAVTGRFDLAPPVGTPGFREVIFGLAQTYVQEIAGVRSFPEGGYTVYRDRHNDAEHMLVMDHGPLGYLSIAAHGHADALSIWLSIDGQPVLVDSGTYLYHSGGDWRDYMRSTLAHNTLSICGDSSSQMSGAFNWSIKANAALHYVKVDNSKLKIQAEHDGFTQKYGVRHQRAVEIVRDDLISIRDKLIGQVSNLEVEIGFLFHPELRIDGCGHLWSVYKDDRKLLEIQNNENYLCGEIKKGTSILRGVVFWCF